MNRIGNHVGTIIAALFLSNPIIGQGLPEGFTRRGDVIFPHDREKEIQSVRHPDSSALQTTVRQLQGQAGAVAICFQWPNRMADVINHTAEFYAYLLFTTGSYPTGSLNDYFLENSGGSFSLYGAVTPWYTSQQNYNVSQQFNWIQEAVQLADPLIDFSQYDNDNDGIVDIVYLIHAGTGREETLDPNDPYSWAYTSGAAIPTNDGVIIDGYTLQPEEHGDGSILGIAVTRHESGHILAQFPDLYDGDAKMDTTTYYTPNDLNDHPMQDWCAMGYGGYGLFSYRYHLGPAEHPTHFCGLFKILVGWTEPVILDQSQPGVTVLSAECHDSASVYKIPINGSQWEYFLIENRFSQHAGLFDHLDSDYSAFFTSFTPGSNPLDAGLIITHVDETMSNVDYWGFNDGTPVKPHYGAVIEDAGYNPLIPWNGTEFTEFWYPYECQTGAAFCMEDAQTLFTPQTLPSTNGYTGRSGIWITNISRSGDVMTFDFYWEGDPPVFAHVYRWPDTIYTGPYVVDAVIFDTFGMFTDSLYYAVNTSGFIPVAHDSVQDSTQYWYTIPYTASIGDSITYYISATDNMMNRQTSGLYAFRVLGTGTGDSYRDAESCNIVKLGPISPNPFKGQAIIRYEILEPMHVKLEIYNSLGAHVTTLTNKHHAAGKYHRQWNGKDTQGRIVANGIYFCRLEVETSSQVKQAVLLK